MFSLTALERRLAQRAVEPVDLADVKRRAAVAIVLHDSAVLLMQRAVRAGDPWSGHISLPGGGYHPDDGTLLRASVRETDEELGVNLDALPDARHLGPLAPLHPLASGPAGVEVSPFVFAVQHVPKLSLGHEAVGAFWLPLDRAVTGAFDATYHYAPRNLELPSWRYEGHVIWGLTWRILADLLELAKP
ncbi:MAG: CoA pyrophosphatase [Proteobacteria bacterium]|nr:CoA pyrophosphatase [Pseudomonadota bacterium]